MIASRFSASSTWVRRDVMCGSMEVLLYEVRYDFAPEQLDRVLHLRHGVRDEEHTGQRRHAGGGVDTDALGDLVGAADQIALLESARLLAERRSLQRFEVLVELRGVKALDRVVMRAADRHRELGRD